jgi:hypothetical protein
MRIGSSLVITVGAIPGLAVTKSISGASRSTVGVVVVHGGRGV